MACPSHALAEQADPQADRCHTRAEACPRSATSPPAGHKTEVFLHSEMVLVPEGHGPGGSLATRGAAVGVGPGLGGGEGARSPAVLQPVVGLGRVCPRSPVSEHWLSSPVQAPAGVRAAQGE